MKWILFGELIRSSSSHSNRGTPTKPTNQLNTFLLLLQLLHLQKSVDFLTSAAVSNTSTGEARELANLVSSNVVIRSYQQNNI